MGVWERFPDVPPDIPHGDMPGDKVCIGDEHIRKAGVIFPVLRRELDALGGARAVVSVCGGSGVGKSEIASVLAFYLNAAGIGAHVISGDNYPRRIPRDNDAERQRVHRLGGVRALAHHGLLSGEARAALQALWAQERDADPAACAQWPWLSVYQRAGRRALAEYLGTPLETDFDEVNAILAAFHRGEGSLTLKRMGRAAEELWYDRVDVSGVRVLLVEWTHGNSGFLEGVDIPILLNSTPEETLAHRRARNRDGGADSAFTALVLDIEQQKLEAQARRAAIILSKQGEVLSYAAYRRLMAQGVGA